MIKNRNPHKTFCNYEVAKADGTLYIHRCGGEVGRNPKSKSNRFNYSAGEMRDILLQQLTSF